MRHLFEPRGLHLSPEGLRIVISNIIVLCRKILSLELGSRPRSNQSRQGQNQSQVIVRIDTCNIKNIVLINSLTMVTITKKVKLMMGIITVHMVDKTPWAIITRMVTSTRMIMLINIVTGIKTHTKISLLTMIHVHQDWGMDQGTSLTTGLNQKKSYIILFRESVYVKSFYLDFIICIQYQ